MAQAQINFEHVLRPPDDNFSELEESSMMEAGPPNPENTRPLSPSLPPDDPENTRLLSPSPSPQDDPELK